VVGEEGIGVQRIAAIAQLNSIPLPISICVSCTGVRAQLKLLSVVEVVAIQVVTALNDHGTISSACVSQRPEGVMAGTLVAGCSRLRALSKISAEITARHGTTTHPLRMTSTDQALLRQLQRLPDGEPLSHVSTAAGGLTFRVTA